MVSQGWVAPELVYGMEEEEAEDESGEEGEEDEENIWKKDEDDEDCVDVGGDAEPGHMRGEGINWLNRMMLAMNPAGGELGEQ